MAAIAAFSAPRRGAWLDDAWAALRPPPKLSLSVWADRHFRLSAESAAEPGRWRTRPYQRAILDAITDLNVERVTVMKSARVGYTQCMNASIAFFMAHDPCPILIVQPTVDTAKIYSREQVAPMLRDVPALAGLVRDASVKTTGRTILNKSFPGGVLAMVGANSGAGFRMVSRRVVIFDEVDGYPASAGDEGDPIALGEKRAEAYWNRKIVAGSTPLVAGASRIEEMFESGDRRRFYVPCPHCGHMDFLRFSMRDDDAELEGGHVMRWTDGDPASACFMCLKCGCAIEENHKRDMLEAGEWRASAKFTGHASFHIWAAYSLSPNATWVKIVAEFLAAKSNPEKLKTFVNTTLGQTWKERGEAPDWERLHARRESYKAGTVPEGPIVLTAGVDVQKDRFVFEVVGWAANKESWSVDAGSLHGDTALESTWAQLDELLARSFPGVDDAEHTISMLAIDSGYNTQEVYGWASSHPMTRVIATKGVSAAYMLIGSPSPVDIKANGKRRQRGYRVWPVGVDMAKSELYGMLGLKRKAGEDAPPGFCHFPEYDEEFFKQLTAEHLVKTTNRKTRRTRLEWHVLPNRENHHLDTRILARVAAARLGLDRRAAKERANAQEPTTNPAPSRAPASSSVPAPAPASPQQPRRSSWIGSGPRRGWLK